MSNYFCHKNVLSGHKYIRGANISILADYPNFAAMHFCHTIYIMLTCRYAESPSMSKCYNKIKLNFAKSELLDKFAHLQL